MSSDSLLKKLEAYTGDDYWETESEEDSFTYEGEDVDGIPSWRIERLSSSSYFVKFFHGWYQQSGDADSEEEVITLMRAMEKASEALDLYLREATLATSSKKEKG